MTKSLQEIQQENRKLIIKACNPEFDPERFDYLAYEITLSKVLLALSKKAIEATYYPNPNGAKIGIFDSFDENKEVAWWFLVEETLEKQSEETQREINKLLTDKS